MSRRWVAGFATASYNPFQVPNAPTGVTATAGNTQASVAFTAPSNVGGSAITSYTVVSSGGQTATGTSSPITVTGLTNDTSYTFTVYATNSYGSGQRSIASNSVTPGIFGQQAYTTAGTYTWTAPANVTSVCVVCVGGGEGGGQFYYDGDDRGGTGGRGGSLRYKNNISVTPGQSYTVVVGNGGIADQYDGAPRVAGQNSYFGSTSTVLAPGGGSATTAVGDGGGTGGDAPNGGGGTNGEGAAGGGAAGYAGNGGYGGYGGAPQGGNGAGGGGSGGNLADRYSRGPYGGGVGILGQGASGTSSPRSYPYGQSGNPGSGGSAQLYGAGSGGGGNGGGYGAQWAFRGGTGAVRIIWGNGRAFPSTNTGDL